MSTELAATETRALKEHEAVIERGLNTFTEVGNALLAIRDERLYRSDHSTFEDYCQQRWGFSERRARQLIASAEVVGTIVPTGLPTPANEGQARELARVPESERAEVWAQTLERTDGKPTAAAIRETYAPTPLPEESETGHWTEPAGQSPLQTEPEHVSPRTPVAPRLTVVLEPEAEQQAADFARLDAELAGEMENTESRFRRNFAAASVKAGELTTYDPERIAEVFTGNWDRDVGDLLETLSTWCEQVAEAKRRLARAGLRLVGGDR
jgi:hypothetical protein